MRTGETSAGGDMLVNGGLPGCGYPFGGYGYGGYHKPGYAPAIALGTIGTVAGGLALLGEWWGKGRRGFGGEGFGGGCGYGYGYPAPIAPMPFGAPYMGGRETVVIEQKCNTHDDYGHGHHRDGDGRYIDKYELNLCRENSALESKLAKLEAEKYADHLDMKVEKEICGVSNGVTKALTEIDDLRKEICFKFAESEKISSLKDVIVKKDADLLAAKLQGEIIAANKRIDLEAERRECCCSKEHLLLEIEAERRACGDKDNRYDLALEAERRRAADEHIVEFVECRYIPGRKYMPCDVVGSLLPCGGGAGLFPLSAGVAPGGNRANIGNGEGNLRNAYGAKTIYKDNTFTATSTPTTTITNSGDGEVVNGQGTGQGEG
jgi:hypothetical protein